MAAQWYVLHSKPLKESLLREQLSLQNIESYYPCIRTQPLNQHARKVKPYFPGYIFGHIDLAQTNLSTLRWLPGLFPLMDSRPVFRTISSPPSGAASRRSMPPAASCSMV